MRNANSQGGSKDGKLVRAKDLVLDQSIDNSVTQALSFYSVATATPPYPRHIYSPLRAQSGGFSVSRELRSRFQQLDDDISKYSDTLSVDKEPINPLSPLSPVFGNDSFLSGSEYAENPEKNNLMRQFSDNGMGNTNTNSSPKSNNTSPKSKTKRYSPLSDLTVRYHNMGDWPAESREPRATLLLVKMNEDIIFRETMLEALRSALDVMDKRYWQYCVERIKATEGNRTILSETLVTLRNHLSEAQKHVAVLIAHVRSLAIELIEKVKQLRVVHARNVKTNAPVSIYWKNENYLLKMRKDMDFINEAHTLRLWLGFHARELVLPPHSSVHAVSSISSAITHNVQPHDPKVHWNRTSRHVYKEWFKKHEAFIRASWKAGKSKVIFKSDRKFLTGDTQASLSQVPPFSMLMSPSITPGFTPGRTPDVSRPQSPQLGMKNDSGDNADASRHSSAAPSARQDTPSGAGDDSATAAVDHTAAAVSSNAPITALPATPTLSQEALDRVLSSPFLTRESSPGAGGRLAKLTSTHHSGDHLVDSLSTTPVASHLADELAASIIDPIIANVVGDPQGVWTTSSDVEGGGCMGEGQESILLAARAEKEDGAESPGLGVEDDDGSVAVIVRTNTEMDEEGTPTFPVRDTGVSRTASEDISDNIASHAALTEGAVGSITAVTKGVVGIAMKDSTETSLAVDSGAGTIDGGAGYTSKPTSRPGSRAKGKYGDGDSRDAVESASASTVQPTQQQEQEVPEWMQLREYAKHSWGCMEVEEEVRDHSGDVASHRRSGFKHALLDSKDGLAHYHKHGASYDGPPTTVEGVDAQHGIHNPTIGFRDSIMGHAPVHRKQKHPVFIQGRNAAPLFWKTVDHNPLVVEAATGFEECFPTIYLVPPMPSDLLLRAEKCALLLRKEYEDEVAIRAQRDVCSELRDSVLPNITTESLESLMTESHAYKSSEDAALLRLRQQGTTELLTGVSVHHLSKSLSLDAGSLASMVMPSTSQILSKQQQKGSTTEGVQLENSVADNVFLTDSLDQGDSQQYLLKASEESLLMPNVQSFGSYVDMSGFNFFRIEECSKLRQRIEDKITEARKVVELKEGELFPTIRADRIGVREPDHNSNRWFYLHALRIQCVIRGFLARRRIKKMLLMKKFNRSAHKVRTLVIGFMWRYRQRQKYWEARFEAFVMRKTAVKKFRASMTLTAFFRKIVRAHRKMREDDARAKLSKEGALPLDSRGKGRPSLVAFTPVSRNVRRKHGLLLTDDAEGGGQGLASPVPSSSSAQISPTKSRVSTAATSTRTLTPARDKSSGSPDKTGRHVTISTEVTEYSKTSTPLASAGPSMNPLPTTTSMSAASTTSSIHTALLEKLTPKERLRRLEAPGPYDESKRREQLRNDALSLVARVNRGKIQSDTLHNCRLIPTQSVPNLPTTQAKMRKFATREYAFLNSPTQPPPQSLIKSSSDVFVGPIPKRVVATHLQMSQSVEAMHNSTASAAFSVSSAATEAHSSDGRLRGGFLDVRVARGRSISALATSGKLATAGSNVLRSSNSSVSSSAVAGAKDSMRSRASSFGSAPGSPEVSPGKAAQQQQQQLGSSTLHFGEVQSAPGSAGHGGVAPLLRYNSTGLTLRSKKQQQAHEKAEAEKIQLRSTLMKYM